MERNRKIEYFLIKDGDWVRIYAGLQAIPYWYIGARYDKEKGKWINGGWELMDAMHGYDPSEAGSSYPSVANTPEVIAITLEAAERDQRRGN